MDAYTDMQTFRDMQYNMSDIRNVFQACGVWHIWIQKVFKILILQKTVGKKNNIFNFFYSSESPRFFFESDNNKLQRMVENSVNFYTFSFNKCTLINQDY